MNKLKLTALLVLSVSAAAVRTHAQVVELGGGIAGIGLVAASDWWGDGVHGPALDARVGVPVNDRFTVEPFVTYGRRSIPLNDRFVVSGGDAQRTEGLWGVVVNQRLRATTRDRFHAFVTYGLAGSYAHAVFPTRQYSYGGNTAFTEPARTENTFVPLAFGVIGGGVRQSIGGRLAVRAQLDMLTFLFIPIGVRASAGIAVPLGRAR